MEGGGAVACHLAWQSAIDTATSALAPKASETACCERAVGVRSTAACRPRLGRARLSVSPWLAQHEPQCVHGPPLHVRRLPSTRGPLYR